MSSELHDSVRSSSSSSSSTPVFVYTLLSGGVVPSNVVRVRVDSSVKAIPDRAFAHCRKLQEVELHDELRRIGGGAFDSCNFRVFRVPRSVDVIGNYTFIRCDALFSITAPKSLKRIGKYSLWYCKYLRNFAIPPRCKVSKYMLPGFYTTSIGGLLSSSTTAFGNTASLSRAIVWKLKRRFYGLRIHEICYFHSYRPTEEVLVELREAAAPMKAWKIPGLRSMSAVSDRTQDCLGMTPLHILACSTKHDLQLYRWVIGQSPQNLITKDKWGDIPILYAIWGNAPQEVLHLLANSQKSLFPDHKMDWEGMMRLLFDAGAGLVCFNNLFDTHQTVFLDHLVDWQEAVIQLAEYISRLNTRRTRGGMVETLRHLLKLSIRGRLNSLGRRKWRKEIEADIDGLPWIKVWVHRRVKLLYTKLASYEQLKELMSLLELALWRAKVAQFNKNKRGQCVVHDSDSFHRQWCRVNCGADAVLPNVLPFLQPEKIPILYSRECPD